MIKQGDIAYVKTTNEPVFVIQITPIDATNDEHNGAFAARVLGRVPVNTRDGVDHQDKIFFIEELEGFEEFTRRAAQQEFDNFKTRQRVTEEGMKVPAQPTAASKQPLLQ